MIRFMKKPALLLSVVALTGCSNLNQQEQRMLSGGAAGTAIGAVGTVMTGGCVACGAAIGGAIGTGAGYIVDRVSKNSH